MDTVYHIWYDEDFNCHMSECEVLMTNEIFTYIKTTPSSKSLLEIETSHLHTGKNFYTYPSGYYTVQFTEEELSEYTKIYRSTMLKDRINRLVCERDYLLKELSKVIKNLDKYVALQGGD